MDKNISGFRISREEEIHEESIARYAWSPSYGCVFCEGARWADKTNDDYYNSTERNGFIDIMITKLLYFMDKNGYSPTDNDWDGIRDGFLEYIKKQEEENDYIDK